MGPDANRLIRSRAFAAPMEPPRIVAEAVDRGASYADVRAQARTSSELEWRDGEMRKAVRGAERGVGVRVLVQGAWGLASTNREDDASVLRAVDAAVRAARAVAKRQKRKTSLAPAKALAGRIAWEPARDGLAVPLDEKTRLLLEAGKAAASVATTASVRFGLEESRTVTRFVSSEGADVTTDVPLTLLQIDLTAREGAKLLSYRGRLGGTTGWETVDRGLAEAKAKETAESAARILHAPPCPSGEMTVITDPDLTGVFAHEAIGHACEADLVLAGESLLAGRIGEKLGSDAISIVDDGSLRGAFGSLPVDDEGVTNGRKALLTDGVLTGYIHSRETAARLGMEPNGGARAESYGVRPLVRMSNTLVEPGDMTLEELVEDVDRGILARGTRGGQVDVAKGTFQFSAQEAVLIEDGELKHPLADVSFSGDILRTLHEIDGVGKEARLASPGICGKGQLVPVGDGGPHVRIRRCVVGGGA